MPINAGIAARYREEIGGDLVLYALRDPQAVGKFRFWRTEAYLCLKLSYPYLCFYIKLSIFYAIQ